MHRNTPLGVVAKQTIGAAIRKYKQSEGNFATASRRESDPCLSLNPCPPARPQGVQKDSFGAPLVKIAAGRVAGNSNLRLGEPRAVVRPPVHLSGSS